ncbi:MAG: YbbR-like domain-containing protein [Ignavibacteriaceae bacterium]|nr:YbbR-like domain-containing protein [Ignavibacteriaceae bacterium]
MKHNLYFIILSVLISCVLWASISLTNEYNTKIKLPIKFTNVPDGYVTTSLTAQNVNLTVKGRGWNLLNAILVSKNDFNVDLGNKAKKKDVVNLNSFASENTWLTSKLQILDINPSTLAYSLERIAYAKVKLVPHLKVEFKPGYGLGSDIIVVPESVLISGPAQKISEIKEYPTEVLEIHKLSEKTEREVGIQAFPELNSDVKKATITLDVQRIVEKTFDNIPIKILEIPTDRDVVLFPNKIQVSLRGGIDVLGKLSKEKIFASVYYRNVVLDSTGTILPNVSIPKHTELVYIKPDKLKYIIKKFK